MAATPATRRKSVAKREEEAAPHRQALREELAKENYSKAEFDEAWYVAQLVEFSHTRAGDVLVKLRVPYLYRHQASKLQDAYGIMLQVHMEPWSQAKEAERLANG